MPNLTGNENIIQARRANEHKNMTTTKFDGEQKYSH